MPAIKPAAPISPVSSCPLPNWKCTSNLPSWLSERRFHKREDHTCFELLSQDSC